MYLTSRSAFQVANLGLLWLIDTSVHPTAEATIDIAIVGIANTVSTVLVALPAGVWIDRVNRWMLLLVSNVVSVACLLLLTFFTAISIFQMGIIVVLVVVWAAAGELYRSTSYAVLPEIVQERELPNANGVTQSGFQIVSSISGALGGSLVVLVGVVLTFVYGSIGYGLSALFSALLVYRFRGVIESKVVQKHNMVKELREGFRWLLTQPGLWELSLLALIFNFVFGIPTYFLVIYVTSTLKAGAFIFGAITAVFTAGTAVGAFVAGRMPSALRYSGKINILTGGVGDGILLALLGLFPHIWIALVASLGIGLGLGFGTNLWLTTAQNLVPTEMRGRYFAIDGLLSFIGGPPAIAIGGILIALIGVSSVFIIGGVVLLISSLVFSFMKSLWKLDGRPSSVRSQTTL